MFKWFHEYSIEIDAPLQPIWDFLTTPSNWPKWINQFDSCLLEGDFKTGAKVKAKIKDKEAYLSIFITEVKPYSEYKMLVKTLFFNQESLCEIQEISPERTLITQKTYVLSLLTPFMKSYFRKSAEKSNPKCLEVLSQAVRRA